MGLHERILNNLFISVTIYIIPTNALTYFATPPAKKNKINKIVTCSVFPNLCLGDLVLIRQRLQGQVPLQQVLFQSPIKADKLDRFR